MEYFIDNGGNIYGGDMQPGDREATAGEIAAWEASRNATVNNAEIKAQLAELDSRSIRTLHEAILALAAAGAALPPDTLQRLQAIEDEKAALRAKLEVTP